jgi:mono/diheme cytochrome c family protein
VTRVPTALAVAAVIALAAGGARAMSGPPLDYTLACAGCHRADGAGTPGSIPPLAGSVARYLAVPGGREFLVRVPGVAQAPLDDAALAAVLNWMLARFDPDHVPAGFTPYDAAEVRRLRREPLTDVARVRRRLRRAFRAARFSP